MEVMLTIFTSFKFIEDPIRERPEALCADKTLRMPQFSIGIDNFLMRLKTIIAPGAKHVLHAKRHVGHASDTVKKNSEKLISKIASGFEL